MKTKKRILFTSIGFHEYDQIIIESLENEGFEVEYFFYSKKNIWMPIFSKSKIKILRKIYSYFRDDFEIYSRNCYANIVNVRFDFVLSINIPLSIKILSKLKVVNPNLKTIYYLWDSLSHYNLANYIKNYDSAYSFDKKDSKDFKIGYLPNFWCDLAIEKNENVTYNLFFLGKYSFKRHMYFLKFLSNINLKERFYIKLVMDNSFYSKLKYKIWKTFFPLVHNYDKNLFYEINRKIISNTRVTFSDMVGKLSRSNCVIDIESYVQNGYSHRVILSLAMNKKIITTNKTLAVDEFINPENIRNVENLGEGIEEWINDCKVEKNNEQFISQLHITNWILKLLN